MIKPKFTLNNTTRLEFVHTNVPYKAIKRISIQSIRDKHQNEKSAVQTKLYSYCKVQKNPKKTKLCLLYDNQAQPVVFDQVDVISQLFYNAGNSIQKTDIMNYPRHLALQ